MAFYLVFDGCDCVLAKLVEVDRLIVGLADRVSGLSEVVVQESLPSHFPVQAIEVKQTFVHFKGEVISESVVSDRERSMSEPFHVNVSLKYGEATAVAASI